MTPSATALLRGLARRCAADDRVAFGAAGDRSSLDLWRDVAEVAQALPAREPGAEVPLIVRQDRYALAVAVLAAWQRGYRAVLPPEHDREAITALASAPSSAVVLHDTASGIALQLGPLLASADADGACAVSPAWAGLACAARGYVRDRDHALVPAPWGEHWLEQAGSLAARLALEPGQRCATSVVLGHPHGVILGVLVPLLAGAAFLREPLAPGDLGRQLSSLQLDALFSVPAHLPELLAGALQQRARVPRLVSALDPLPPALRLRAETDVATRVEDLSDARAAIPVLDATRESARNAPEDELLVELLRAQPGVRDAAVVALDGPSLPGRCVAVTGSQLDAAALRARVRLLDAQAELLVVRSIRRDALGQTSRRALLRQFRRHEDGSPLRFELGWGEAQSQAHEQRVPVTIPADYPYFEGHFPGYPILAGAVQLSELVLPFVRRVRPELGRLTHMARLKFSGRIQPGETIDVVLQGAPGQLQLDFTLRRANAVCAAGTLGFAPREAP